MTDQDFRDRVIAMLSSIEAKVDNVSEDVNGLQKTLFGAEGRSGLVGEVQELRSNQGMWNRGLAIMSIVLTAAVSLLGYFFKWGK